MTVSEIEAPLAPVALARNGTFPFARLEMLRTAVSPIASIATGVDEALARLRSSNPDGTRCR